MPVQTVEAAVNAYSDPLSFDDIAEMPFTAVKNAFKAGASWQKEQGIEWIKVEDGLPETKHGFVIDVLVTNGIAKDIRMYDTDRMKFYGVQYIVTHWAYINLPKTDK